MPKSWRPSTLFKSSKTEESRKLLKFKPIKPLLLNPNSFTETWLAYASSKKEKVVVKTIFVDKKKYRMVEREIECLNELGLLIGYDFINLDNIQKYKKNLQKIILTRKYQIVYKFVPGQNLEKFVKNNSFTGQELLSLFYHIAAALAEVHKKGYIHRDLKPNNIIINNDTDTIAKLIDFGMVNRKSFEDRNTKENFCVGNMSFAAPEALSFSNAVNNQSSDVASLGYIYLYLLECLKVNKLGMRLSTSFGEDQRKEEQKEEQRKKQKKEIENKLKQYNLEPEKIIAVSQIIQSLIDEEPGNRLTAEKICEQLEQISPTVSKVNWLHTKKLLSDDQEYKAQTNSKIHILKSKKNKESSPTESPKRENLSSNEQQGDDKNSEIFIIRPHKIEELMDLGYDKRINHQAPLPSLLSQSANGIPGFLHLLGLRHSQSENTASQNTV